MKKITSFTTFILLILIVVISGVAKAYYDDKDEDKCREPKIQEFNLPEYRAPENKEIEVGAEFSFIVSGWADPKKIKVTVKDAPIPFEVINRESFHKVTGKIPNDYVGKYIRLNARIPAVLGCYTNQGWLLKIVDKAGAIDPVKTTEPGAAPAESTSSGSTSVVSGDADKAISIKTDAPVVAKPAEPEVKIPMPPSSAN